MIKLFIPGPTYVCEEILQEMSRPQIGHRTDAFRELFGSLRKPLQKLFFTKNDVLISTSSGSGLWEASIRNCVNKKVLHATNGFFSEKWAELSKNSDKEAEVLKFDYGKAIDPDVVDEALSKNDFEAFCMPHCETPTGATSNLKDFSRVMKKHKDVLWFVDCVSTIGGMKVEVDKLGIDFCFTSSQKAMAMPPGLSFGSVSDRCYEKAENVSGRGYYFDILSLKKEYDRNQTTYTPTTAHLYALKKQLERIEIEGLENRFKRHAEMAEFTRDWAINHGFDLFTEKGFYSDTSTTISNNKNLNFKIIVPKMLEKNCVVDPGFVGLNEFLISKGMNTTFRIAHMGDLTLDDIKDVTGKLEELI